MAARRRVFRVAEQIRMNIASELLRVADPRFHLVTITSVVVSPDLRQAKVYWVVTNGKDRMAEVKEAFESAAGMFQRVVAKELGLRFTPVLKFFYDDTFDTVDEVERLMHKIRTETPERDSYE